MSYRGASELWKNWGEAMLPTQYLREGASERLSVENGVGGVGETTAREDAPDVGHGREDALLGRAADVGADLWGGGEGGEGRALDGSAQRALDDARAGREASTDHHEHKRKSHRLAGCDPERDEPSPLLLGREVGQTGRCDQAGDVADRHDDDAHVAEARADPAGGEEGDDLEHVGRDAEQGRFEDREAHALDDDGRERCDEPVGNLRADRHDEQQVRLGGKGEGRGSISRRERIETAAADGRQTRTLGSRAASQAWYDLNDLSLLMPFLLAATRWTAIRRSLGEK